MIKHGKYTPLQKFEKVCAYWQAGPGAEPELAETDRLRRPLLKKWEGYARSHARAATYNFINKHSSGIGHRLIEDLIADFCHGESTRQQHGNDFHGISTSELYRVFRNGALDGLDYTEDDDEIPSLDALRQRSLFYPAEYLRGQSSALAVFVTYFLGRNDVLYIHDAGIERVTLVDLDAAGLAMMRQIYPADWTYVAQDFRTFLDDATERGDSYDVVSCDQPLHMAEEVAWTNAEKFLRLCRKVFITNYTGEMLTEIGFGTVDLPAMSHRLSERLKIEVKIDSIHPRIQGQRHHWVVVAK
jgi:hypothetical protein